MSRIKVALVGYGYWGPKLARTIANHPDCELSVVVDASTERLKEADSKFEVRAYYEVETALNDAKFDAVVVATPIEHHYKVALAALRAKKDVLIQKPMASHALECQNLNAWAKVHQRILMVAHTFMFSPAYQKAQKIVASGELGELNYISSTRINLGLFQRNYNVIWDLAPHDFSLFQYLIQQDPITISAVGASHTKSGLIDVANITVRYPNSLLAMAHVNWLSPVKTRNMIVSGRKKTLLIDESATDKLRVYDSGVDYDENLRFSYRKGDVVSPLLDDSEPLMNELDAFVNSIKTRQEPISNGVLGAQVVQMIQHANTSASNDGRPQPYTIF